MDTPQPPTAPEKTIHDTSPSTGESYHPPQPPPPQYSPNPPQQYPLQHYPPQQYPPQPYYPPAPQQQQQVSIYRQLFFLTDVTLNL